MATCLNSETCCASPEHYSVCWGRKASPAPPELGHSASTFRRGSFCRQHSKTVGGVAHAERSVSHPLVVDQVHWTMKPQTAGRTSRLAARVSALCPGTVECLRQPAASDNPPESSGSSRCFCPGPPSNAERACQAASAWVPLPRAAAVPPRAAPPSLLTDQGTWVTQ